MLLNALSNANVMPVVESVQSVYLSEIDYNKPTPYFLLAFRYKDGGTTASYIEKANADELVKSHATLAAHLAVGKWTNVENNGSIPSITLN